jgi:phosphoglycolate phosphatase-like HAD superfamily hydrolase
LPHSEALLTATAHLGLAANHVLVVSDTDVNLRSARAAEMATAGVLSGLGEERDLRDADLVLPSATDLVEWL